MDMRDTYVVGVKNLPISAEAHLNGFPAYQPNFRPRIPYA